MSYKNKKIIGFITARGGSKGLPKKNILLLGNKPLISWTILSAQRSKYLDRTILSTDSEEIANVAQQFECEVPFLRPKELAEDTTSSVDVISHILQNIKGYDYFVLLQPTSPFRNSQDIDACIERCINLNVPSCVSVSQSEYPQLIYSIEDNLEMIPLLSNEAQTRRQDMKNFFSLNGAVYVVNVAAFEKEKKLIFKDSVSFVMPEERSLDIDSAFDFLFAEFILQKKEEPKI